MQYDCIRQRCREQGYSYNCWHSVPLSLMMILHAPKSHRPATGAGEGFDFLKH
jgi:hypothetical protein